VDVSDNSNAEHNSCDEPLPADIARGIEELNAGQYFEQHETLERAWRTERRPVRNLYRGILQIGVACLHLERGNALGALKMLDRGCRWLEPFRPTRQGIDVERLLSDVEKMRDEVRRLGLDHIKEFDRELFPKVHYRK
jgi:predicted metal-dependent hydrolase